MVSDISKYPQAIAEARQLIGVPLRRERHYTQASRSAILRWSRAIGDRNPLFLEEGYARNSAVGSPVAPPCWLYAVDNTLVAPKLPGLHALYAGTEWEFYRWVRQGDEISVRARLLDVQEKEGRFCGPMVLQTGEVTYFNGWGEAVARALSRVMRTGRKEAAEKRKYLGWEKHRYSSQELMAVEDTYDGEELRGPNPRFYGEVRVGEELRPLVRGPLTSEDMLQFINATAPVKGFSRFVEYYRRHPAFAFYDPDSGMPDSWEASLVDDKVARLFGFPFAHDAGIDRISWVGNLLTNWMGDHGFLKRLKVDLLLPNIYGDATWCKGRVVGKRQEAGEGLVEIEVWCHNQRGWKTAQGTALLALPRRL